LAGNGRGKFSLGNNLSIAIARAGPRARTIHANNKATITSHGESPRICLRKVR